MSPTPEEWRELTSTEAWRKSVEEAEKIRRGRCPGCRVWRLLGKRGCLLFHRVDGRRCPGSGAKPLDH